ncbi:MAG TPA: hypothetical protein VFO14_23425 [Vicinamibacterales bacterium]|nr:hypothetical protein [Vicinamibacterales bacterium]
MNEPSPMTRNPAGGLPPWLSARVADASFAELVDALRSLREQSSTRA